MNNTSSKIHLNYASLLPMYLATMQDVKANHPYLWNEFKKGNFCVTKSKLNLHLLVQFIESSMRTGK